MAVRTALRQPPDLCGPGLYLNEYPDHWTQGENLEDLKEHQHLRDLFQTFSSEQIPGIRKVEELEIA
jgi:hypothetical protein